jgi:PAS domain S-box-containing protein
MTLVGEDAWERRYELAFGLWLERAESEFLNGNFDEAERLIGYLLERANSKIRKVAAYRLKILLHMMRAEPREAVDSGLECLLLFGVEMPACPTREDVRLECAEIWQELGSRAIESLIDLPLMTDSEARAAMDILSVLVAPAFNTNVNLMFLFFCRMVKITLTNGISGASAHGIADFATILGPVFHRYDDGYRFGKLACGLIERYKFNAFKTKVYFCVQRTMLWTQSIQTAIDYIRLSIEAVVETHDLVFASFSWNHLITVLLLQGARLDEVWRESQNGIDFVHKIKFRDEDGVLRCQQWFILTLLGETAVNARATVDQFRDQSFEAGLETTRKPFIAFLYWTLKTQVQYLFGDYQAANCAAQKAKPLFWSAEQHIQSVNYFYYTALTATALYETVDVQERVEMLTMVQESLSWLREWAVSSPGTFLEKYSLVMAEVARIEGRHLEAIHLYEQAVRTARENGFVQNEAIANELAAKFYFSLHNETSAYAYLRNASYCYLRWGALGKVRQLNRLYPQLMVGEPAPATTSRIGTPVENLDLATVIKVSQAVSGEMVLERLIDRLMRTAIEHAGAERGLLIVQRSAEQRIEAEATTSGDTIIVRLAAESVTGAVVPESVVYYVARTQESVILDDASVENPFSADTYFHRQPARSVLCLPLINQAKLIGVLYLENTLAPDVFTPRRIAVLKLLASQAAISLENTRLYRDLEEREAKIRRLVDANIVGIFIWNFEDDIIEANEAFLGMVGYTRDDLVSGELRWTGLTSGEYHDQDESIVTELRSTGVVQPFQKELLRKDGSRVPVMIGGATFEGSGTEGVAFVLDLSGQKRTEEALQRVQTELAHMSRVLTVGELAASIAHEVDQPLTAIVANAGAGLRWLANESPNLEQTSESIRRIIRDGKRASAVIARMRALFKKAPLTKELLDINEVIEEVLTLLHGEIQRNGVSLRTQFCSELPFVTGDRVQLQQLILNLVLNAIQAMSGTTEGPRECEVSSGKVSARRHGSKSGNDEQSNLATDDDWTDVLVTVRDSGPGVDPELMDRLFEAFYTSKAQGLGMGLAISRSIIEAHGGQLWAKANSPRGLIVQFTLPLRDKATL